MERSRTCFVPDCNTGYRSCKDRISLFSVPKNETRLRQWVKAIPRKDKELSIRDAVCAKHFVPSDIITEWTSGEISIPYKRPRLASTAVPTIFKNYTSFLTKSLPKKPRSILNYELNDDIETGPSSSSTVEDETHASYTNLNIPDIFSDPILTIEVSTTTSPVLETDIFSQIWNKIVELKSPNSEWAVHFIEKYNTKHLLISECSITENGLPYTLRQVIIKNDCSMDFFVSGRQINYKILETLSISNILIDDISAVENTILKFYSYKICFGGPSTHLFPASVIKTKVAEIETTGLWRHKKCTMIFKGIRSSCGFCWNLNNTFSKQEKRPTVRCMSQLVKKLRILRHNEQKHSRRLQNKNIKLQFLLQSKKKEFKQFKEANIFEQLSQINLPPTKLLKITECINVANMKSENGSHKMIQ